MVNKYPMGYKDNQTYRFILKPIRNPIWVIYMWMDIMVTINGLLYVKTYSKLYKGIYLQDQLSGVFLGQITKGSRWRLLI